MKNTVRCFSLTLILSTAVACADSFDLKGARAGSDFGADDDGWTIVGDAQAQSVKPDYDGTGGNPDGLISAKDDVTGGVWFFLAPAKYAGDARPSYGRELEFDLKISQREDPFDDYDVVLAGGGVVIAFDSAEDPVVDAWSSYAIALAEGAGWRTLAASGAAYGSKEQFAMLPAATQAELMTVLGALESFRIRGEFNTGPDTGALDNVRFGAEK